jgi:hypothetical protein
MCEPLVPPMKRDDNPKLFVGVVDPGARAALMSSLGLTSMVLVGQFVAQMMVSFLHAAEP